tara:strand:- start:487 stop:849 length:363 start_codon:yes stop_codon:yes gene_type:complete
MNQLKRQEKVVATVDLPGVPEGTEGKIRLANGIRWFRYWIDFTNGVQLGRVDHENIVTLKDWPQFQADRLYALENPEEFDTQEGSDNESSNSSEAGESNEHGVPEHLLERSRAARARLGA